MSHRITGFHFLINGLTQNTAGFQQQNSSVNGVSLQPFEQREQQQKDSEFVAAGAAYESEEDNEQDAFDLEPVAMRPASGRSASGLSPMGTRAGRSVSQQIEMKHDRGEDSSRGQGRQLGKADVPKMDSRERQEALSALCEMFPKTPGLIVSEAFRRLK